MDPFSARRAQHHQCHHCRRSRCSAGSTRGKRAAALGGALWLALLAPLGCGGDDDTGAKETMTQQQSGADDAGKTAADSGAHQGAAHDAGAGEPAAAGSSGSAEQGSDCAAGCEATLAADCAMGPDSQQQCVDDCERLRQGSCGSEYGALMQCARGEAVTCSGNGLPIIAACDAAQSAFVACLNP